jgi:hypothetical protein
MLFAVEQTKTGAASLAAYQFLFCCSVAKRGDVMLGVPCPAGNVLSIETRPISGCRNFLFTSASDNVRTVWYPRNRRLTVFSRGFIHLLADLVGRFCSFCGLFHWYLRCTTDRMHVGIERLYEFAMGTIKQVLNRTVKKCTRFAR